MVTIRSVLIVGFLLVVLLGMVSSGQIKGRRQINYQRNFIRNFNYSEFDFTGKVVLITGSSGGLGAHLAREFAKRGARLMITGRREQGVRDVTEECRRLSPQGFVPSGFLADVTQDEQMKQLVNATIQQFGKIDILVNNAGGGVFGSVNDPELMNKVRRMMDLNLHSVVSLTHYAMPHLERSKGNVVVISSVLGQQPNQHFMPYCVSKAAVDMFCKSIAIELGPKGVRVNYVSPTAMRTNFQAATGSGEMLKGVLSHLEQTIPMRRIGQVEDVSHAVMFLASDKSSFITGTNLVVDGGNSLL